MATEHPAESHREWLTGIVTKVYPDTWEVDVQPLYGTSGLIRRCRVLSHFLPELHTEARQSKVLVGWVDAYQQGPVAVPIHHPIIPADAEKADYVYWSEHLGFRITVKQPNHVDSTARASRTGELEIRNLKDDKLLQIRVLEDGAVIRIDTPNVHLRLNSDDEDVLIETTKRLRVEAGEIVEVACDAIRLGEPATERVPLGEQLKAWCDAFVATYNGHHHGGGTPPVQQYVDLPEAALSDVTKTK